MGRLFGTDGVRGKAGEYPLDRATVRRLGAALARAASVARCAASLSGASGATLSRLKSSRKELPRILIASVCVSIRTQTGAPGRPGVGRIVKRVTRPVASLPPSGLILRTKSTGSPSNRALTGLCPFRASAEIR